MVKNELLSGTLISTCLGEDRVLFVAVVLVSDLGELLPGGEYEKEPELGSDNSDGTYEYSSGMIIGTCLGREDAFCGPKEYGKSKES